MVDQCNSGKMYGSMECGAICYSRQNDDSIQGHLLLGSPIHATKTTKMEIEGMILANAKSKYVANFEVYCGKDPIIEEEIHRPRGEAQLAYNVVLQLVSPYEGKGHVITMDNFFLAFHYSRNY